MLGADDNELLRRYVEEGSEEAFATLVSRHINKVYSVALRHTRNPHHAEEITQAVFVILAKKSCQLDKKVILSGWLYHTARLTAVTFIRSEIRRARREEEAYMQTLPDETDSAWKQISPLLDAAISDLNANDRDAIVLRFFDGKSMREVAEALGTNEIAVKKRVNRALEKLRSHFARRGVVLPVVVLTATMSANSIHAAPVGLIKIVAAGAIMNVAAASSSTSTLIEGALKIMAWIKAKTAITIGLAALLVGGTATTLVLHSEPRTEFPRATWKFAGYADPESAFMTYIWATCQTNGAILQASLTPAEQLKYEGMLKMNMKVPREISEAEAIARDANRYSALWKNGSYRLIDRLTVSTTEVVLHVYGQGEGVSDERYVKMKRIGNEWKYNGVARK